jgi:GNAT superfamily N-acetyltransferase
MDAPRPARDAPPDELLELVHLVRRELHQREEAPTTPWVEGTANDLRAGRRVGFYFPIATGGGIAFRSERGPDSYGHVHVERGERVVPRAVALASALLDGLPGSVHAASVGFTGMTVDEEAAALAELVRTPGSTVIRRFAMERPLGRDDEAEVGPPPAGLRRVGLREVNLDALADLDWRAFEGSVDALLIGRDRSDYRRVLEALLDGRAGRFLDEASTALYRAERPALLGALLTCEKSPRHAAFLDFMVDPDARRAGLGRHLLAWGFRALRALGYERVRLWVSESNAAARRLYESVGFAVTHATQIYRWDRPDVPGQPHSVPYGHAAAIHPGQDGSSSGRPEDSARSIAP